VVIHFLRIVDDPQVPTILRGCRRFLRFSSHAGGRILAWTSLLKVVVAFRPSPNLVQEEAGKMTVDELVRFNPILANAFAKFEAENDPEVSGCMQSLVAVAVKTGVEPEKIYATIKTGRMLTTENRKFLSKAELKEWQDAGEEYRRLAKRHEKKRVKKA
jgi:hypothetical protein